MTSRKYFINFVEEQLADSCIAYHHVWWT